MFRCKTTAAIVTVHDAPSDRALISGTEPRELAIAEAEKVAGGSRSSGSGAVKCVFESI